MGSIDARICLMDQTARMLFSNLQSAGECPLEPFYFSGYRYTPTSHSLLF